MTVRCQSMLLPGERTEWRMASLSDGHSNYGRRMCPIPVILSTTKSQLTWVRIRPQALRANSGVDVLLVACCNVPLHVTCRQFQQILLAAVKVSSGGRSLTQQPEIGQDPHWRVPFSFLPSCCVVQQSTHGPPTHSADTVPFEMYWGSTWFTLLRPTGSPQFTGPVRMFCQPLVRTPPALAVTSRMHQDRRVTYVPRKGPLRESGRSSRKGLGWPLGAD